MSFYQRLHNGGDPNWVNQEEAPGTEHENDEVFSNSQIERVESAPQTSEDEDVVELEKMSDYKSFSKGMMDIALMTANANQLRTALFYPFKHKWIVVGFIIISLILQVLATCLLILEKIKRPKRCLNSSEHREGYKKCQQYNIAIAISVVLIIILNIFITAFGVPDFEPGFHPDKEPSAPSFHPSDDSFFKDN